MSSDSRIPKGERSAKCSVHRHVHRGVHLNGQRNSRLTRRMPQKRWFTLYAAKSLNWRSDCIAPQDRGPIPPGFGGHSRLLLLEDAARVLAAQDEGIGEVVRQGVRQIH